MVRTLQQKTSDSLESLHGAKRKLVIHQNHYMVQTLEQKTTDSLESLYGANIKRVIHQKIYGVNVKHQQWGPWQRGIVYLRCVHTCRLHLRFSLIFTVTF